MRQTPWMLWALGLMALVLGVTSAQAQYGRQYYGDWHYYPQRSYWYRNYNYKPYPTYEGYYHHYCVYYPTQPRYVYYYNPYQQVYWGRLDLEAKGDKKYSMLAKEDRKESLKDIPEKAFPAVDRMPAIPEAKDETRIEPIKATDLPPNDLPK